jgi:hypothetical protein
MSNDHKRAKLVGTSKPSKPSTDPDEAYLEEMRSKDIHPSLQYEFIRATEDLDEKYAPKEK